MQKDQLATQIWLWIYLDGNQKNPYLTCVRIHINGSATIQMDMKIKLIYLIRFYNIKLMFILRININYNFNSTHIIVSII